MSKLILEVIFSNGYKTTFDLRDFDGTEDYLEEWDKWLEEEKIKLILDNLMVNWIESMENDNGDFVKASIIKGEKYE